MGINKDTVEHLPRITFAKELQTEEDLLKTILTAIRSPLQKALQKDLIESEYLSLCLEKQVLKIRSIEENDAPVTFPVTGARNLKVRVEILHERMTPVAPKLNVTINAYQGLEESLVKRVKDQLTMQELIECFS